MKGLAACFALILGLALMPGNVSAQTARELQNQGHELYKSGNYTAALSKLEASLRLSDYYYAHYLKYLCHEKLDQEDEATASINRAVELAPEDLQLRYIRALHREMYVGYIYADQDYSYILDKDSRHENALLGRAGCRLSMKRYESALTDAERATSLFPQEAEAWELKGRAQKELGRIPDAIQTMSKAISLEPTAYRHFLRSRMYESQDDYASSAKDLSESIRLEPSDPDWYYFRADAYDELGKMELKCADTKNACELGRSHSCSDYEFNCSGTPDENFAKTLLTGTYGATYELYKSRSESGSSTVRSENYGFDEDYNPSMSFGFELKDIAKLMKISQDMNLQIDVHVGYDQQVLEAVNKATTKVQGGTIKDFLIEQGVSADRIMVNAHGAGMPIVPNDTPANRRKNARVEFKLVRK